MEVVAFAGNLDYPPVGYSQSCLTRRGRLRIGRSFEMSLPGFAVFSLVLLITEFHLRFPADV